MQKNKKDIVNFERVKIATYPKAYQKAILAVLTPERKKKLWAEKVNQILTLDLPKEQIEYLRWYALKFQDFDYSTLSKKEDSKEMYDRTIVAMMKFGWTKEFVYETFFVLGDVDLKKLNLGFYDLNEGPDDPPSVSCDCKYDLGCPGFIDCVTTVNCNSDSESNCGFFGHMECEGSCGGV